MRLIFQLGISQPRDLNSDFIFTEVRARAKETNLSNPKIIVVVHHQQTLIR